MLKEKKKLDKFEPSFVKILLKMDSPPYNSDTPRFDIEKILDSKNPKIRKFVPGFIVNYLKRIVHQEDLNAFMLRYGHLKNSEFIKAGLSYFGIKYTVSGKEKIPGHGRYIFVSNHPLGGLDGLVFMNEVAEVFPDIKFPVNDILTNIENLSGIFLPVNKHGFQGRDAAVRIDEAYSSDSQILYFPAGLCSRKRGGEIKDLQWQKSFIQKALQYKRDIIPAYFSGRNSDFFYTLSNIRTLFGIKFNIEMLYLADEMFKQKNKEISLKFGEVIKWCTFDKSKTSLEWADWVKTKSYELGSNINIR